MAWKDNAATTRQAAGRVDYNSMAIACRFDPITFGQIHALAVKNKTSFAEQVRQLVEIGLEIEPILKKEKEHG